MEVNARNEKLKRQYFRWLLEAEGYSEETIRTIERAICVFEEYTGHADFATFCERQAVGLKKMWHLWVTSTIRRHISLRLISNGGQSLPGYSSYTQQDGIP